jgi:DNA repair protein RadC
MRVMSLTHPNTPASPASNSRSTGRLPARSSDAELLAQFLGLDPEKPSDINRSWLLLKAFGGVRGLFRAQAAELAAEATCKTAWASQLCAARELFKRQLEESLRRGNALTSPSDTLDYLRTTLRDRRREVFCCLFLDTRHRVLANENLFLGSIDGACVYPRVVAEKALRHGAAAIIVAHNHPSGVTEPSLADQAITRRLKEALALLEIRLLDHFVIGDGKPVSMASRGML